MKAKKLVWQEKIRDKAMFDFPPRIKKLFQSKALKPIKRSLDKQEGYYIHGESGTGKTVMAHSLLLDWRKSVFCEENKNTIHDSIIVNAGNLQNNFKKKIETNEVFEYLEELKKIPYLIIDDIGCVEIGNWLSSIYYELINYRYDYMLPTIYTSNFKITELAQALGNDRIASRIYKTTIEVEKNYWDKK